MQKKYIQKLVQWKTFKYRCETFHSKFVTAFWHASQNPHNFDDAFEIGQLTICNNDKLFKIKKLLIREDSMCTNPALNISLKKTLFLFYIIFTILTLDLPRVTNNSTIECYKTFMFRERWIKIKMPTSSMVKNWCCLSNLRWFHIILAHDSRNQEQPWRGRTYPCLLPQLLHIA